MNCTRLSRIISAYVDGELSGAEMFAAREHLGRCPSCTEELESIRLVKRSVSNLAPVAPSPALERRLISALDAAEVTWTERVRNWVASRAQFRLEPATVAVAACAGMLLLALGNLPDSNESEMAAQFTGGIEYSAPTAAIAESYADVAASGAVSEPAPVYRTHNGMPIGQHFGTTSTSGFAQTVSVAYAGVYDR